MEIIDTVDELSRREQSFVHCGHEKARPLLRHIDALVQLMCVEVADLRRLSDLQIVRARCCGSPARYGDGREIRLRLENDRHLLGLRRVIQVIVEDARISRHRVPIENADLLDILGAVGEEQRPSRVIGLHGPSMHETRCTGRKDTVARRLRRSENIGDAVTDIRLCHTALVYNRRAAVMLGRVCLSRRTDECERHRRHFLKQSLIHAFCFTFPSFLIDSRAGASAGV